MYVPTHFEEPDADVIEALVRDNPLALIVTSCGSAPVADLIPLIYRREDMEPGTLIGHVARANDLWHDHPTHEPVLVVFQGINAYITPNWYQTKSESHQVVPTWNYMMVQMTGTLVVHDDPKWVRGAVGRLTQKMEASEARPWRMAEAPADYITEQLMNIVGIEIHVRDVTAKSKVSQNRVLADRQGVITGLRSRNSADDRAMADAVDARLPQ